MPSRKHTHRLKELIVLLQSSGYNVKTNHLAWSFSFALPTRFMLKPCRFYLQSLIASHRPCPSPSRQSRAWVTPRTSCQYFLLLPIHTPGYKRNFISSPKDSQSTELLVCICVPSGFSFLYSCQTSCCRPRPHPDSPEPSDTHLLSIP